MDFQIMELRKKLIDDINEAQLPLEVKRLVLFEITKQIEAALNNLISQEAMNNDGESVRED